MIMSAMHQAAALSLLTARLLLAQPAGEDRLMYDARVTHDLAAIDLTTMAGNVAVVRITPAGDSGSAMLSPPSAGEPGGTPAVLETGTWEVLFSERQEAAPRRGTYRWTKPRTFHQRRLFAGDFYSPFSRGGTILSEFHPQESGEKQFQHVTLLPPDWTNDFGAALRAVRKTPPAFDDAAKPVNRRALVDMTRSPNVLLACLAFRRLLSIADTGGVSESLAVSRGYKRAALVYMTIMDGGELRGVRTAQVLQRLTADRSIAEAGKFTALGVFSARLLAPDLVRTAPWTTDLLASIKARLAQTEPLTDPYYDQLFR
jgi:hypothetical protein